jgi:enterobactin synthetase component D
MTALRESQSSQWLNANAAQPVATMLRARVSRLEAVWDDLWQKPVHAFATVATAGAVATLDLLGLEAALLGVDLRPMLPVSLAPAVRRRQLSFVGGRLCAERCLAQLGDAASAVGYGRSGEPIWPQAFQGSITHTRELAHAAAVAAGHAGGIGIDSEHVVETGSEIVASCCTQFERDTWFRDNTIDPLRATLLFSAKESFYKAVYPVVQRFVDFNEVEVAAWNDPGAALYLRPRGASDLSWVLDGVWVHYEVDDAVPASVHTAVILPPFQKGHSHCCQVKSPTYSAG